MDSAPAWRQRMDARFSPVVGPRAVGNSPSATNRATAEPLPDNRLRKSDILRGYGSFRAVLSQQQSIRADGLRCYHAVLQKIPPGHVQVGFAVRRPTGSVERNRFKRLLREAYRCSHHELRLLAPRLDAGYGCVIMLHAERFRGDDDHLRVRAAMESLLVKLCDMLSQHCEPLSPGR